MATYVGSSTALPGGGTASVNAVTGQETGDFLIAIVSVDNLVDSPAMTGGSSWQTLGSQQNITNGDTQVVAAFYKFAGASEPGSYPISGTTAGNDVAVVLHAWRGVDSTTPIAAFSINNPNTATPPNSPISMDATSITTTAENQTLIWMGATSWNVNTPAPSFTASAACPSTIGIAESAGVYSSAAAYHGTQTIEGATGTVSVASAVASANGNSVTYLIALTDAVTQNVVLIPSGTSFTLNTTNLPGYNGLIDKIECIGGGGAGLAATAQVTNLTAGGGAAYALSTAVSIALNTAVTIQIGAGGATEGAAGTDTWFNGASLSASSCGAKGGGGATGTAAGAGGASGSCIISGTGSVAHSGGNGGANGVTGASGGGGAGGPLGVGGAGGIGSSTSNAGGGGGGNGGGSAGAAGTTNGGAGGNNNAGSGGGAAGTSTVAAVAGTNGGGGGGAAGSGPGTGANGAEGTEWTLTAGGTAGSGGGGGGGVIGNLSGNGAVGGGGGAGGGTTSAGFGTGGNGFIVLTYTPSSGTVIYTPFTQKLTFVNEVNVQF